MGLTVPPMGIANLVMGALTGQTLGDAIIGGPAPPSGSGPGGTGGPGNPQRPTPYYGQPTPPGPSPFRINPTQVQNDMNGGWGQGPGGWGGYQQPTMNPFSMYGSGQPSSRGYNPFSMYGGGK